MDEKDHDHEDLSVVVRLVGGRVDDIAVENSSELSTMIYIGYSTLEKHIAFTNI
jgi:hypothetical protein